MLLTLFERGAEYLLHLVVHQHRQPDAEAFAQFGRQCEKSAKRGLCRIVLAGIEYFTDHRLFMGDKGVAGLTGLAPERRDRRR